MKHKVNLTELTKLVSFLTLLGILPHLILIAKLWNRCHFIDTYMLKCLNIKWSWFCIHTLAGLANPLCNITQDNLLSLCTKAQGQRGELHEVTLAISVLFTGFHEQKSFI